MQSQNLEALHRQWQNLVGDYARARREAERDHLPAPYLRSIDEAYGLKIEIAYTRLREAEKVELLFQH